MKRRRLDFWHKPLKRFFSPHASSLSLKVTATSVRLLYSRVSLRETLVSSLKFSLLAGYFGKISTLLSLCLNSSLLSHSIVSLCLLKLDCNVFGGLLWKSAWKMVGSSSYLLVEWHIDLYFEKKLKLLSVTVESWSCLVNLLLVITVEICIIKGPSAYTSWWVLSDILASTLKKKLKLFCLNILHNTSVWTCNHRFTYSSFPFI